MYLDDVISMYVVLADNFEGRIERRGERTDGRVMLGKYAAEYLPLFYAAVGVDAVGEQLRVTVLRNHRYPSRRHAAHALGAALRHFGSEHAGGARLTADQPFDAVSLLVG